MSSPFQQPAGGADIVPAAERPGRVIVLIAAGLAALGAAAWGTVSAQDNTAKQVAVAEIVKPGPVAAAVAKIVPRVEPEGLVPEANGTGQVQVALAAAQDDDGLTALPAGSARFGGVIEKPELVPATARNVAAPPPDDGTRFGQEQVDIAPTASITAAADEEVGIAESESDVLSMEAKLAAEGAEDFSDAPVDAVAVEAAARDEGLKPARANTWVNLRSGPGNDASVLAVVPYDAAILAEKNCRHWCEVVYDGRKGFIYKTFIR
jgi:hypothetical protein